MLGALFSTAASTVKPSLIPSTSSSRPPLSLDSVQEDIHTRNLLFPDPSKLSHDLNHAYPLPEGSPPPAYAPAGGFDSQSNIDLESPRDIRILVAQEATAQQSKVVLYDSRSAVSARSAELRTSSARPNQAAFLASSAPPAQPSPLEQKPHTLASKPLVEPRGGVFDRSRRRTPTAPTSPSGESGTRPLVTEPVGETRVLLECMFGTAPLSYRGDSTKFHILPNDDRSDTRGTNTSPIVGDVSGSGSFGRAEGRKRSQLAQSYTPRDLHDPTSPTSTASGSASHHSDKRTVLITRTFSINLPSMSESPETGSQPVVEGTDTPNKKKRPKPRKTPMYAIAVVLTVPTTTSSSRSAHTHRGSKSGARPSLFSAPFGRDEPLASPESQSQPSELVDSFYSPEAYLSSIHADSDERVELIVDRWDVVTQCLSAIQRAVTAPLLEMLERAATVTAHALDARAELANLNGPTGSSIAVIRSPKKSKEQTIQLTPGVLSGNVPVLKKIERSGSQLIEGLRIPRVVSGQGRWGMWREEARWVGRWGGGKEHKFFFYNLLTAFLGTHTAWLEVLGPRWYRKRHHQRQGSWAENPVSSRSRTVVVANDKMAARRLIFLLSSFLPSARPQISGLLPLRSPSCSSLRGESQSLPSVPPSREESLRRTMDRRRGGSRTDKIPHGRHRFPDSPTINEQNILSSSSPPTERRPARSSSDTQALQSMTLPIPQISVGTRKSSGATTATSTPATTVPHFSSLRIDPFSGTTSDVRPGSSGSVASLNLMHSLRRNNGTDVSNESADSQSASRWGSLISGFWSNRRDSSTDDSETTIPQDDGLQKPAGQRSWQSNRGGSSGKRASVVKQPQRSGVDGDLYQEDLEEDETPRPTSVQSKLEKDEPLIKDIGSFSGTDIPARPETSQSLFKLSVDENDGVIDVDVPMPGFLSPLFGSPNSSMSTAGCMSTASLESSAMAHSQTAACPFASMESASAVNVAGWLKRYHPDFVLQAVRPYQNLEEDVRESMQLEASPSLGSDVADRWVEVCSTIIADTDTFSVKRLSLRRHLKTPNASPTSTDAPSELSPLRPTASHADPLADDEEFLSEPLFSMEDLLIDAVERVIAQSHPPSRTHSRKSSLSHGLPQASAATATATVNATPAAATNDLIPEIPRAECQKMIVGALEQVARAVAEDHEAEDRDEGIHTTRGAHADNALREGVRRWLVEVEELR
ncbi:MAG: hypothetical protein M1817_005253 [Caeruleum heppii]|nr:MAG: hypothetical protein M1817_005253 [Caeruleum heppii]